MSARPLRNDTRNDSHLLITCPVCGTQFEPSGRRGYCTPRCRQRAHRLRHRQVGHATLTAFTAVLQRQRRLVSQTIYECPACQTRLLGERRCSECNLLCRKVGVGGECLGCGELMTVADLLGLDLHGGDAVA
jgi:hypothetical protein